MAQQRILWIALFRGIGDAVLFYPALKRSVELFPGAEVSVALAAPQAAEVLRVYGFGGDIMVMPSGLARRIAWVLRVGLRRFDVVLDASSIQQMHLSRWLAWVFSNGERIGYHYGSSSRLYTQLLDTTPLRTLHQKDIYANMLKTAGGECPLPLVKPLPQPGILNGLYIDRAKALRIVVHPGGRDNIDKFEKRWPAGRYVEMISRLRRIRDCRIVIVGNGAERAWIEKVFAPAFDDSTVSLAGQISVAQLFEIIRTAGLFVGNNSGPLHIAAACGTPIVTFAGGIPLKRWGPASQGKTAVVGLDKRCTVCTEYECADHGVPCLEAITVDEVMDAIEGVLSTD